MAYVDRPGALNMVFFLFKPDGQMATAFPPALEARDMRLKAEAAGGLVIAVPVSFVFDGRVPGSTPYVPRADNPVPVTWPADPVPEV